MSISISVGLSISHLNKTLKQSFETFNFINISIFVSPLHLQFYFTIQQITQPLKFEKEELYKQKNDRKENIFTKVGSCLLDFFICLSLPPDCNDSKLLVLFTDSSMTLIP